MKKCLHGAAVALVGLAATVAAGSAATLDDVMERLDSLQRDNQKLHNDNEAMRKEISALRQKAERPTVVQAATPRNAPSRELATNVSSAMAANYPVKSGYVEPSRAISWSGFYVGGHVGYGSATESQRSIDFISQGAVNIPFDLGGNNLNGGLGGGQIGFRYQMGTIVLGAEGEYSWADLNGASCGTTSILGASVTCSSRISSIASATGQFGVAYDRALFYLKGGGAWVREKNTLSTLVPAGPLSADGFATDTNSGWTAGAGFEFAFSNNWSARAEYDFISLGNRRALYNFGGSSFNVDIREQVHLVKLGINYKFDWMMNPVFARD